MFFLFFFSPSPTPHLPSPQTLEGKTNKTNKSKFHTSCSTVFSSNGHTPIGPRFVYPCTNEQIMNEQGWKWSLIESEPSVLLLFFYIFFLLQWLLTTSAQMFRISNREAECSPSPAPQPPTSSSAFIFIYFSHRRTVSHQQWCNSIFICFLLFGFHRKGRWAFLRLICLGGDPVPAFRASGAVWTKPSVWVGRFIKWQTGSLCLANVPLGRRR